MLRTPTQPIMSYGLLLFLFTSLAISGTAGGRRHKKPQEQTETDLATCPRIRPHTPDFLHFMMTTSQGMELASIYIHNDKTSNDKSEIEKKLSPKYGDAHTNRIGISEEAAGFQSVEEQNVADHCIKVGPCDHSAKYRTINGTCNNLRYPMHGIAGSALVRLVPAKYHDGDHKLRRSRSGKELPNVRQLSSTLFVDRKVPDKVNVYNVMQWGQLVAHDTTHLVQQDSGGQMGLDCCQPQCAAHADICDAVPIPQKDPFYYKFHQTCLNMVRSATTSNLQCPISPQQQVIVVTHFLDASLVYGSSDKVANKLRAHKDGLLDVRPDEKREFPPQSDTAKSTCDNVGNDQICYEAGDSRVNQNTGITVLQILLLREHNRVARELKKLNPHWDDERLYQEARKIVGAVIQRITYNEYLPIILGKAILKKYSLIDGHGDEGYVNAYNETINPSTLNEFATAAFRAFHSMVPREIILYDEGFNPVKTLNIDDFYFRPSIIQKPGMFDKFLRGLAAQPAESQDTYFSVGVTNYLFKSNKAFGKDLETADMQRGRDHGLATYNDLRRACGLPHASHFGELINFMHQDAVKILESKYESVEDIDLFVGGMMETRAPGALVGPTFACIIAEQFMRWRNGDRFYYEFDKQPNSFTFEQLVEIRKSSLAELLCRNGDDIDRMPVDAFHAPGDLNPIKLCKNIVKMDLKPWKEEVKNYS